MRESGIQTAIENLLALRENRGQLLYIKNNSGAVKVPVKGRKPRYVRFGKKGSSDFIVFAEGGVIFLEVKNEKGRQSPSQKEFQSKIEALGYAYYIVRGVDEVDTILKDFILLDDK